jgi:hypothetical protein
VVLVVNFVVLLARVVVVTETVVVFVVVAETVVVFVALVDVAAKAGIVVFVVVVFDVVVVFVVLVVLVASARLVVFVVVVLDALPKAWTLPNKAGCELVTTLESDVEELKTSDAFAV